MNKLDIFLKQHASKLILILLILTYTKGCGNKSELTYVKKELRLVQDGLEDQAAIIEDLPTNVDLQIEGLKSEFRAISASDRRVFDVQRQAAIEALIDELEAKQQ